MDKQELREKIAGELFWMDWDEESGYAYRQATNGYWEEQDEMLHKYYLRRVDQILSLIEPLIEEAKKQEMERIAKAYEGEWYSVTDTYCPQWLVEIRQALEQGEQ
jgi:hypothetical protein